MPFIYGHEPVAPLPQLGDDALKSRAILRLRSHVEEVDGPRLAPLEDALEYLLFGIPLPSERVSAPHDVVLVTSGVDVRQNRGVVVAVGGPEVGLGARSRDPLYHGLGLPQFVGALLVAQGGSARGGAGEGAVRVGVVHHRVPVSHYPSEQGGMSFGPLASHPEARLHPVGLERVEDPGGVAGVGAGSKVRATTLRELSSCVIVTALLCAWEGFPPATNSSA